MDFSGQGLSFWAVADHGALNGHPNGPQALDGHANASSTGPGGLPLTPRGVNLADQRVDLEHLKARAQQLPVQDTLHWQRQNAKARTRSGSGAVKGNPVPQLRLAGKS